MITEPTRFTANKHKGDFMGVVFQIVKDGKNYLLGNFAADITEGTIHNCLINDDWNYKAKGNRVTKKFSRQKAGAKFANQYTIEGNTLNKLFSPGLNCAMWLFTTRNISGLADGIRRFSGSIDNTNPRDRDVFTLSAIDGSPEYLDYKLLNEKLTDNYTKVPKRNKLARSYWHFGTRKYPGRYFKALRYMPGGFWDVSKKDMNNISALYITIIKDKDPIRVDTFGVNNVYTAPNHTTVRHDPTIHNNQSSYSATEFYSVNDNLEPPFNLGAHGYADFYKPTAYPECAFDGSQKTINGQYQGGAFTTMAQIGGYDLYPIAGTGIKSSLVTIVWEINDADDLQERFTSSKLKATLWPQWTNFRISQALKNIGWTENTDGSLTAPSVPYPYVESKFSARWGLITDPGNKDEFPAEPGHAWLNGWGHTENGYGVSGPFSTSSTWSTPISPTTVLTPADIKTTPTRSYALGLKVGYYKGSYASEADPPYYDTDPLLVLGNIVLVMQVVVTPEDTDEDTGWLAPYAYVQGAGMSYPSWITAPNWSATRGRPEEGYVIDNSAWIAAAMIIEGPQGGTFDSSIFDTQSFLNAQINVLKTSYSVLDENETPRIAIQKLGAESYWAPAWLGQGKLRLKTFRNLGLYWPPVLNEPFKIYWEDIVNGQVKQDKTPDEYIVNEINFKYNYNVATDKYEKEVTVGNAASQAVYGKRITDIKLKTINDGGDNAPLINNSVAMLATHLIDYDDDEGVSVNDGFLARRHNTHNLTLRGFKFASAEIFDEVVFDNTSMQAHGFECPDEDTWSNTYTDKYHDVEAISINKNGVELTVWQLPRYRNLFDLKGVRLFSSRLT